ncbi:MAG TPA: WYL domain-containing protein [Candidatus Helicobacter avistercoris]|nr:WYL domain-containing protein [Candidatus Helicobacter avistercoris]
MNYPKNKKYSRIEQIYHLLENHPQGLSIKEIANEFGVSAKTIQRDLYGELVSMGAYRDGRFWKLNPKKKKSLLELEEENALSILQGFSKNMGECFEAKSSRIFSTLSPNFSSHIHTHLSAQNLSHSMLEKMQSLQKIITSNKEVNFLYRGKNYHLKPLKVAYFDGFWYLLGLDLRQEEKFKKFILSEVSYLFEVGESVSVGIDIDERIQKAHSIWFELGKSYQARLKISPLFKEYFHRKPLKTQKILGELEDGCMEVEIEYTHDMELCEIFMKYFPHISILTPSNLQSSILQELSQEYQTLLP